jgi:hypothetical protein
MDTSSTRRLRLRTRIRHRGSTRNPARVIRAIPLRILRQVLLVIVGAENGITRETNTLSRRKHSVGRLPIDASGARPVDRHVVQVSYFGSILVG